jgi:hypothetical protein
VRRNHRSARDRCFSFPIAAPLNPPSPTRASKAEAGGISGHLHDATPAGPVVGARSGATAGETAPNTEAEKAKRRKTGKSELVTGEPY